MEKKIDFGIVSEIISDAFTRKDARINGCIL